MKLRAGVFFLALVLSSAPGSAEVPAHPRLLEFDEAKLTLPGVEGRRRPIGEAAIAFIERDPLLRSTIVAVWVLPSYV